MATFTGWQAESGGPAENAKNLSVDLESYVRADLWPPSASAATAYDSDAVATALPIDQPAAAARTGAAAWSYLRDFYYRVHIVPSVIRLGPIVQDAQQDVEVWSAWFQANTLNAIQQSGTGGLTLTGPVPPPTDFLPLDSRIYVLSVDLTGPANVDALYTFDFSLNTPDPTLAVTGDRAQPWPFPPNWDAPVTERLEWRTDVLRSHNAKERRAGTRNGARLGLEYTILRGGDRERVILENLLHSWQSRLFGLPLWHQQERLDAPLPAGTAVVPVDTENAAYEAGGLAALVNGLYVEVREILAVDPGQLTLTVGAGQDFPAGSVVAPARLARLPSDMQLGYPSDGIADAPLRFEGFYEEVIPAEVETDEYRGYAVHTDRRDWAVDVEAGYQRFTNRVDFQTGLVGVDDRAAFEGLSRSHGYLLDGRAALAAFREYLSARSGRRVPVWLPSGHSDFLLLAPADASLVVENRRHVQLIGTQVGRRDIMVWLQDGTRFYRRITGGSTDSPDQETITLDTPLGQTVTPEEVRQISYLSLARLAADAVELAHLTDAVGRVAVSYETIRDDVP